MNRLLCYHYRRQLDATQSTQQQCLSSVKTVKLVQVRSQSANSSHAERNYDTIDSSLRLEVEAVSVLLKTASDDETCDTSGSRPLSVSDGNANL